ncbi:MAG: DUF58 domain-containing protein [Gammaproteobacteria bacterium]
MFILPTRFGWLAAGTTLLLLLLALNYQNAPIFVLGFLFAALGAVAMVATHRHLRGLELGAAVTTPVFAGEPIVVWIPVANPSRRTRRALAGFVGTRAGAALDLAANAQTRLEIVLPARDRGRHYLRDFGLASTEPFGTFRAWSRLGGMLEVIVYPRPAAHAPPPPGEGGGANGLWTGDQPEDFIGLARYRPGDRPSQIAWRAYARGGEIERKDFGGRGGTVAWFDFDSAPGTEPEARLSILTRWVLEAERGANPAYGLRLPGYERPPARGVAHRAACLRALAIYPGPYDVPSAG